jgi:hypothetical protein
MHNVKKYTVQIVRGGIKYTPYMNGRTTTVVELSEVEPIITDLRARVAELEAENKRDVAQIDELKIALNATSNTIYSANKDQNRLAADLCDVNDMLERQHEQLISAEHEIERLYGFEQTFTEWSDIIHAHIGLDGWGSVDTETLECHLNEFTRCSDEVLVLRKAMEFYAKATFFNLLKDRGKQARAVLAGKEE